ncbi:MAG: hypothetical protein ABI433_01060 [Burkholderiaceae bacterium]
MKYIVIDGSFRDSDGSLKGPGQSIELDEDMALHHQGRVRAATPEEAAAEPEAMHADVQAPVLGLDADQA